MSKKKRVQLAGQVRHNGLKSALKAVEDQMGELHIQAVKKAAEERRGR